MNFSAFEALSKEVLDDLYAQSLLDALIKLDELATYGGQPSAVEAVRTLRQDYSMLLSYMRSGGTDVNRKKHYTNFLRKAYRIYNDVCRVVKLEHSDGHEATIWKRLHQSPEKLAEIYIPFVEGEDMQPATISAIIADPLASYQQLFDTIWTSSRWTVADRQLLYNYVMNDDAPRINRLSIISATGLALLLSFDEQKFLLLLSVIEEHQVEISIRALVMSLFALSVHGESDCCPPSIMLKFDFLRELTYFHPLVVAVQKAMLVAAHSPELARDFEMHLPEHLEKAHERMKELPQDASSEEIQQYIDEHPKLQKFRDEMVDMMHDYIHMQGKGVDLNYHSFSHMQEIMPFFEEAANWFCPFTFDHPLLFNINAATRFLSVVANNKSCDTDRYAMVFAMAPHLPEIHIVKQDAVTLEETKIEGDDVETFMEQLSAEMEQKSLEGDKSLLTLSPKRLQSYVVSYVQDCYRFFTLFKPKCKMGNPFEGDLRFWQYGTLSQIFKTPAVYRELADWLFELEDYDEARRLYQSLEPDVDILKRMGYIEERVGHPDKAQEYYRKALYLAPDDEWTQRQLLASYRSSNNLELAGAFLEELLVKMPDNQRYTRQLAEIYIFFEAYDKALKLYSKLHYLRPDHLPTRRALAWCHMALEHYDKSSELYLDIIGEENVQDEDFLNAGHCALLQGDISTAVIYYQECLKMRGKEFATPDLFLDDIPFLSQRGVDAFDRQLIIDLLNI